MKIFKNTTIVLAALAAVALASCNNDQPEFNDKDAFVSFTDTKASVDENKATLEIPVQLSSLKGKEGTVDFEIIPDESAPAVEGTNYTVANASRTLTFTKESNVQNIKLNIVDLAGTFTGDVRLTIKLKNAQGVNLGTENTFQVTIADLDHPLAFMLGTFSASGPSLLYGATTWNVEIKKDDSDVNKVWIYKILPKGTSDKYPVYGTVNEDKTELRIPVEQNTKKTSSEYCWLEAFGGVDGDNLVDPVEDFMVCPITTDANGNAVIKIPYVFGIFVTSDAAGNDGLGWYEIINNAELRKAN